MAAQHTTKKRPAAGEASSGPAVAAPPDSSSAPPRRRWFSLAAAARRAGRACRDRSYWFAALAGAAGAVAFEPLRFWPLIPLAPLGGFLAMRCGVSPLAAARRAFVFSWVYYFGALQWLCSIYVYNPAAPLGIMAMAGYYAAYGALAAWLARKWLSPRAPLAQFWGFAGLWILGEYVRTLGRLGAPLAELGHAWATHPALIQIASVLGELGVSLEVMLAASLLLLALQAHRGCAVRLGMRPVFQPLAMGVTALALAACFLPALALRAPAPQGELAANFRLLQPNIDQMTKLASYWNPDPAQAAQLREAITALQENMLAEPADAPLDLTVFPESSFTEPDFWTNKPLHERISRMARGAGSALLVGGDRDVERNGADNIYNSVYLVRADGAWAAGPYDKMRLVPFGEDIPYLDVIPGVSSVVGIGEFSIGARQTIFPFASRGAARPLRFGALICFESTFASMARGLARLGADFIVVVTNDGWYGRSAGAAQHANLSLLRAVETRRWILRCANTGISMVISPRGEVVKSLGLMRRGVLDARISFPAAPPQTFFVRWGHSWLCGVALGLALIFLCARREKFRRPDPAPSV